MKKICLLILIYLATVVSGCAKSDGDDNIHSLADLNKPQRTVGAIVGAASEPYVGEVLPNAVEKQFNTLTDVTVALESGQVDAMIFTRDALESIVHERPDKFQILDEPLGQTEMYTVVSPQTKLTNLVDELNEFLDKKSRDGSLQKMYDYWFVKHETAMPPDHPKKLTGTGKKLIIGTFGNTMPKSFYANNELVGFDIEFIELFAVEYGYEIEYRIEDIVSLLTDTEFGKLDMISGSIMYTPERAERVIFPKTPIYKMPISAMIRKNSAAAGNASLPDKLADLNDPQYTVGAVVGTASEPYVGEVLPNAVEKQFNTLTDATVALESGQVDAAVFTRATLESVMHEHPDKFQILDEPLGETEVHTVVSPQTKLNNLVDELNEFLDKKARDGTLQKIYDYWFVKHETAMPPDHVKNFDGTKKLVVGTLGNMMPQSFYANNELVGFDIELIEMFAAEYGYEIEYRVEDVVSLLADAEFGKIDMISGSIMYTPERAERVIFPKTPLYKLPISVMIRNAAASTPDSFLANLKTSFEKTLIREDRYKMILDGLKVTLIIAAGSLVLGTVLGFVLCMMKRSSVKIVAKLTTAFIALISGLPIVLTLMICFYIIFSGTGLTEIAISIIAFAIDFGCYVAIILNSGIESVDAGEIEAATAMGMSTWQIFRTITFPQAVQKIFGVYRRQVISLIKATSIVGYIAVQDLTKVSDIIRARTYDAFFSLIFTAAIYFLIARLCIFLLDVADNKLNRRKKDVAE